MRLLRPRGTAVAGLFANLAAVEPTFAAGGSVAGEPPAGFSSQHAEAVLGRGPDVYDRAVEGLKTWRAHQLLGMTVLPEASPVVTGATVLVAIGTRQLALVAPCRVTAVVDGADRWGFTYATLPGHPEQGEESFVVTRSDTEEVRFAVSAFSRPAGLVTRAAGPIGAVVQRRVTAAYLRALQRHVERRHPQRGAGRW